MPASTPRDDTRSAPSPPSPHPVLRTYDKIVGRAGALLSARLGEMETEAAMHDLREPRRVRVGCPGLRSRSRGDRSAVSLRSSSRTNSPARCTRSHRDLSPDGRRTAARVNRGIACGMVQRPRRQRIAHAPGRVRNEPQRAPSDPRLTSALLFERHLRRTMARTAEEEP